MPRTITIDTKVFEEIEHGNLEKALAGENARFRRAVVENDEAAKLDNQDGVPVSEPDVWDRIRGMFGS